MNQYTHTFMAKCPVNEQVIRYTLVIQSSDRIMVEDILQVADALPATGFHEDIADALARSLPGRQFLYAHHHGVDIATKRGGA